jgi:hypothetical protein
MVLPDGHIAVAASLQQQHADVGILSEPPRYHRAGGA